MKYIHHQPYAATVPPPHTCRQLSLIGYLVLPWLINMPALAATVNINTDTTVDSAVTGTEYLIGTNGHLTLGSNAEITGSNATSPIILNAVNAQLTINSGAQVTAVGAGGATAVYVNNGLATIGAGGPPSNIVLIGNGENATALRVSGSTSTANVNGATLRAEGPNNQRNINSGVAAAQNGATLNIDNALLQAAVTSTLNGGFDGVISRANSQTIIRNSTIDILHDGAASGIVAEDNGSILIENSQINMNQGDDTTSPRI